ncbi:MAG: hypothetical protein JSU05_10540 [Bacteroidetes bacterium]|nr:hypothetical protein [Bacteroidota bacterium]
MNPNLEQRIALLEKNIRFYQIVFGVLIILAGALASMSFRSKSPVPDVIQAKAFQVVDDAGNVLVEINKEDGNGQLSTYTPTGTRLVSLFTSDAGCGAINTFNYDGKTIFKVTNTSGGGGYMALFNNDKKEIAEFGVTDIGSGYFRINDNIGNKQAWITYTKGGGGYFSLSNNGNETIRLSTADVGGRIGIYNDYNTRIAYMGTQENRDGQITTFNSSGSWTGGLPK